MDKRITEHIDLLDLGTKLSQKGVMTYDIETIVFKGYFCSVDEFLTKNSFTSFDISKDHEDFIFFLSDVYLKYDDPTLIPSYVVHFQNENETLLFFCSKNKRLYGLLLNDLGYSVDIVNFKNGPVFEKYFVHRDFAKTIKNITTTIDTDLFFEVLSNEDRFPEIFSTIVNSIFKYFYVFPDQELDRIFKHILVGLCVYDTGFVLHIVSKYYKDRFFLANTLGRLSSYRCLVAYDQNRKTGSFLRDNILANITPILLKTPVSLIYQPLKDGVTQKVFPKTVKSEKVYEVPLKKMKIISINNNDNSNTDNIRDMYLKFRVYRRQGTWENSFVFTINKMVYDYRFTLKAMVYNMMSKVEVREDYDIIEKSNIPENHKFFVYKISKAMGFDLQKVVECFTKLPNTGGKDRRLKKKFGT